LPKLSEGMQHLASGTRAVFLASSVLFYVSFHLKLSDG